MTTTEQELTLFGGWVKVQIPTLIENGVSISLHEVSASKGLRLICLVPNNAGVVNGYGEPMHTRHEYTVFSPDFIPHYSDWLLSEPKYNNIWQYMRDSWMERATKRMLQIWGKSSTELFRRGFKANQGRVIAHSGILIGQSVIGTVEKTEGGEFKATRVNQLFPKIRPLPAQGVQSAKAYAKLMAQTTGRRDALG